MVDQPAPKPDAVREPPTTTNGPANTGPAAAPTNWAALVPVALGLLAVGVVVIIAHAPVLTAQAISLDDHQFVIDNHLVNNPSFASAWRFFSEVLSPSTVKGYYLPLAMTSLMLDVGLGARPPDLTQFHRTALLLHVLVTLSIVWLLYRLFGSIWPAMLIGVLFGVHPLTVEPVAWVGERKTLLATLFSVWCLILYVRHTRNPSWGWYVGAIIAYGLALLSKPTSTPLPVLLIALDFWPLRRLTWRSLLDKVPFFVLGAVFVVITLLSHQRTGNLETLDEGGVLRLPLLVSHLLLFYLAKLAWPTNLTSVYMLPAQFSVVNVVLALALAAATLYSLRRTRAWLVGIGAFVLLLAPTLGFVDYSWISASDKYLYLPGIALLLPITAGLCYWWNDPDAPGSPIARRAGAVVVVALLAAMGIRGTRSYLQEWQTTERLCQHMLRLAPESPYLHNNYAGYLLQTQRFAEAEPQCRKAIALKGDYPDARTNLGYALRELGQVDAALEQFHRVLKDYPQHPTALLQLAVTLLQQGRYTEAVERLKQLVAVRPFDADARKLLGSALLQAGRPEEAASYLADGGSADVLGMRLQAAFALIDQHNLPAAAQRFAALVQQHPQVAEARRGLGLALAQQGQMQKALAHFRAAAQLAPDNPQVQNDLAILMTRLQPPQPDLAEQYYRKAIELKPDYAAAHAGLGHLLGQVGRTDEAISQLREALRLNPDIVEAQVSLGTTLGIAGQTDEALAAFTAALALNPNHLNARFNRARLLLHQGRPREAMADFRAAVDSAPDNPQAHYMLAVALEQQGQLDEAVAEYRTAVGLAPNVPQLQQALDAALAKQQANP